jgi:Leucine-rich repeat (LRR) protein
LARRLGDVFAAASQDAAPGGAFTRLDAKLEALAVFLKAGGTADFKPDGTNELVLYGAANRDELLARLADVPFVNAVTFKNLLATDAGLRHLAKLPNLRSVTVRETIFVGEPVLKRLCELKNLEAIQIEQNHNVYVTDAGLAHLGGLPKLRSLKLQGAAEITDAGAGRLKALVGLRELDLAGSGLSDAGLTSLKALGQLQVLGLSRTKITDAGLARLVGLIRLRKLDLSTTAVDGTGLSALRGMTELRELDLSDTRVTDAGLNHLPALADLRKLNLERTKITRASTEPLRRALPRLSILR